ncbi:MAG: VanZ family protein [Chloroflexi bacterium]|nr:VanZ family protein [Chloroflexota bacterium]MCI0869978.1 VanZ family protein [Chloroflexota bacterium]
MKTRGVNIALYWGPVLIWMVGIYLLSNTTLSTLGQIKEGSALLPWYVSKAVTSEYVVHTFEFGVLAVLVYRLLLSIQALRIRSVLLITLAWAVAFGILDEIHQSFVAGRHGSLSDVGLDSAGAFIAVALVFRLGYFRR